MPDTMIRTPFPQSYWVRDTLLCAGHYPGALDQRERDMKLAGLLDCQIRRTISLIPMHETGAGGKPFDPYEPVLQGLATSRGLAIECLQLGFPDASAPARSMMTKILDVIDASIAAGEALYVHCWGGHGRTSTVVGCYLVRHGLSPQDAIEQILAWRKPLPRNHYPYENEQAAFVCSWRAEE
jgi:hypothetical protein